jgi:hypothetical protein
MKTEFDKWWNEDDLTTEGNNFVDGTPAWWAWEGWCAAVKAERNSWPAEMEAMERQVNILTDALNDRQRWFDALEAQHKQAILAEREACAKVVGEFAQKWWSIHCASNKHMETTRKAHDDFCALQAAIRARSNT